MNFREGWRGYLWRGRIASTPMDEDRLMAAARYVELNLARAGLAARGDGVVRVEPLLERAPDWTVFLDAGLGSEAPAAIQAAERTGRPPGDADFVATLEQSLGRVLARHRPGRKPRAATDDQEALF